MFLRSTSRKKDGKEHRYFSIVENKRVADGRVMQRHVLYWARSILHKSWRGVNRSKCSKTARRDRARWRCFPQIDFEAASGKGASVRYTLLHTNRTYEELDYYQDLLAIEAAERFDFVYVPSVSRPTQRDWDDPKLGRGRANNMLRYLLDMPLKEEQDLQEIAAKGGDTAKAKAALEKTVKPALPKKFSLESLRNRFDPSSAVVVTCGNPWSMEYIKYAADARGMRFEKEDW